MDVGQNMMAVVINIDSNLISLFNILVLRYILVWEIKFRKTYFYVSHVIKRINGSKEIINLIG